MPTLELRAFLEHQLEENPFLEIDEPDETEEAQSSSEELNGKEEPPSNGLDEDWVSNRQIIGEQEDPDNNDAFQDRIADPRMATVQSLHEALQMQLGCLQLSEEERRLGEVIIHHLDDSGYLEGSLEELAAEAGTSVEQIEGALRLIHRLDPPGVGARDLRECLMIQLEQNQACGSLPAPARLASPNEAAGAQAGLAYRILKDHFPLFTQKRLDALVKTTGASSEEVVWAYECLKQLNPKPGRAFSADLSPSVIPDLVIHHREKHYDVELNDQDLPNVSMSRSYYRMLKDPRTPSDAKEFLVNKFRQAGWLIKAIDERNATLLSIARCVISLQGDFLEQGQRAIKPLTQAQVAGLIGRHPSTVSRAITGKTIDTPYGVFRLEQLFASGVPQSAQTESVSDEKIKSEIRRLIEEEDPRHPLSDAVLVERLLQRNVSVARRTIAKYRTSLKILPGHLRKQRL